MGNFIDNQHCKILNITLLTRLSLSLAHHHIQLDGKTKIEGAVIGGIDVKTISLFTDMRHEYVRNIVPTQVSI